MPPTTYHFHPGQTFDAVRAQMAQINQPGGKGHIAKLTWLDGTVKGQTISYLYDPMAERFGHMIDKESISVEIVSSLLNGIPVDVTISKHAHEAKN